MKFSRTIEDIFSNRKNYFWYGHTVFWFIILVESTMINPESLETFRSFNRVLLPALSGFIVTYFFRVLLKKLQVHRYALYLIFIVTLIYSVLAALIWTYSYFIISYLMSGALDKVPFYLMSHFFEINFITIALWCGLYLGYKIWEEWNNEKYQLEHERALLRTSQLEMLKYQLNPHFLFNTLSSLRGLITAEPMRAREMVTQISEFLRYSLLEGKNNEVQLIKEIEIIKLYLNIEQVRYNEDLVVEFNISPESKDFMIPIFLIHPLVENAVKHGMQTSKLPLNISIYSKAENSTLTIEVINSGKWIEKDKKINTNSTGIGLQNIKKRLEHSYLNNHSLEMIKNQDSVKVVIKINFIKYE
ncbi:MAG: histidine kinase [Melioribacteraceae bacterium]